MGVSEATFFRWKQKFGCLGPSELRQLRQLQKENTKLKKLVADLSLDKTMLQDVLRKCMVRPARARIVIAPTVPVCINVSGLSRVSCCCSQAMMRSARTVLE